MKVNGITVMLQKMVTHMVVGRVMDPQVSGLSDNIYDKVEGAAYCTIWTCP